MMGKIHIGCSGWNYRHWRGLFYPAKLPARTWFAHYAECFDTVEINNSFYRLPSAEVFDAWREQAPSGFRYAVKANRFLTHQKKLKDPAEPLARMFGNVLHLGDKLGPILYQLPPRWRLDLRRLHAFLDLLPPGPTHVFEFREPSWMTDVVFEMLDACGASFCTHDMPGMTVPRLAVGRVAYVRFHGSTGKYWGRYSAGQLADWQGWMESERQRGRDVYAYFNNDIHGHAIEDALALKRLFEPRTTG